MNIYNMFDTLNTDLDHTKFDFKHIQEIFNDKLEFDGRHHYKNGSSTTYYYKNYSFTLTDKKLSARGSLSKFYYGNNVQNLNFNQVQQTLAEFESLFEIPFDDAKVKRIDMAYNMVVDRPINQYFDLMTTPENYKLRYFEDETKYFESAKNKICFYDKVEQLRKKDRDNYLNYKNSNVLKYEVSLTKNIAKNLGLYEFTFKDLYNPEVYQLLLNIWHQSYFKIPKLTRMLPSQLKGTSLTALKDSMVAQYINLTGGLEIVNMAVEQILIKKNVKFLAKKYLKGFTDIEPLSPILQHELDSKIDLIYNSELLLLK